MDRFCVYESPRGGDLPKKVIPSLERYAPDCLALTPEANGEEKTILSQHFLEQAGLPAPIPKRGIDGPSTRLVFVDTQSTKDGLPDPDAPRKSEHGFALANIAHHLVSDSTPGAVEIATRLALAHVDSTPKGALNCDDETSEGGAVGKIGELATAIDCEILHSKAKFPHQKVVLNLSVGWDPSLFGGLHETEICQMAPYVQAVYLSLENAAEKGALVIAAAGTHRAGPNPVSGPILPAGWEGKTFDCTTCGAPRQMPLIYAVGGVQSDGYPLANSRPGGSPSRVAYADHASVTDSGGQPTASLTGSSVAAAVVSSTAAVVWHFRPDLDPAGVMDLLRDSGNRLDRSADFYFGKDAEPPRPVPKVRRISLCPALLLALKDRGVDLECPCWDLQRPLLPFPSGSHLAPDFTENGPTAPCRADRIRYENGTNPGSFCPSDEMVDRLSEPWVYPQPDLPPCLDCNMVPPPSTNRLASRYVLQVEIAKGWDCLDSPTLHLDADSNGNFQTLNFAIPTTGKLCPGTPLKVEIPIDPGLKILSATLSFVLTTKENESFAVENPVLIAR